LESKIQKVEDSGILEEIAGDEQGQLDFFYRSKKQIAWTLWKERKDGKLVREAEEWSARLQQLTSYIILPMFPNATEQQIAIYIVDSSGSLTDTNLKGKIILSRSGSNTTIGGLGVIKEVEEGPFKLSSGRVQFLKKGLVTHRATGELCVNANANPDDIKSQLGGNTTRQWATLVSENGKSQETVIVEFKTRATISESSEPSTHSSATFLSPNTVTIPVAHDDPDHLVRTLRLVAHDPSSFRVLQCEGWIDVDDKNYGLIYRLPAMKTDFICESLTNILLKPEYCTLLRSDLENRLKLARALARTLLQLHIVDWVHESFYPDNILLFGEQQSGKIAFDWAKPYLVGFGSSRPNTVSSSEYNYKLKWSYKLHNHPDRNDPTKHNPFKKLYDIYSLGVVLLELGRGRSLMEDPRDSQNAKWSMGVGPQKLKENLIQEAMDLPVVLGRTYRGIVLMCLNEELRAADYEGHLTDEFRERVCEKLEQIKVNV
jgi:serine/threonine protein kinase